MKTFLTFCATATFATAGINPTAWRWEQVVDVTAPGMTQLDLPPATLDASQPSLADLRLIAPDGVETPWLLENTMPPRIVTHEANNFRASLEGRSTVLTARNNSGAIGFVTLNSPARGFLKLVQIEGSNDGQTWQPIASGEIVFRQGPGAERLRVPVSPGDWSHLRVTLDDDRSPPVAFTGMSVTPASSRATTEPHDVNIANRGETAGQTQLTLSLGAKNLNLEEIAINVSDGVFSRSCKVSLELPSPNGPPTRRVIGSGTIYRVLGENGAQSTSLTLTLNQRVPTDSLIVTIANGDSPPLDIRGATAARFPERLLFFASQAGRWKLLTGNRHASSPRYDLSPLRKELTQASAIRLTPGPLTANPDYQAPQALPDVEPAGSGIDLSRWGRRRSIQAKLPGVVRIELDMEALAHLSDLNLADLRLIQDGRQIPWLREPNPRLHTVSPRIIDEPDPERPTVSRWKILTPSPGLPFHSIEIESPDPLFTRSLSFLQHGKDELGNPWTRTLTSKTWTQAPGDANSRRSITVPLDEVSVSDALWIETDNGDNPPIRLENIIITYQAPAVIAKITSDAPVFLYYENPMANSPDYDLNLVRAELLSADRQEATLGREEILESGRKRNERDLSAGSPWLWGALALVVVVLLFIVAKMLPKEAESRVS